MRDPTPAELLLDLALELHTPNRGITLIHPCSCHPICPTLLTARAKLALDLQHKGPTFALRAIFEQWDHQQLLRELY